MTDSTPDMKSSWSLTDQKDLVRCEDAGVSFKRCEFPVLCGSIVSQMRQVLQSTLCPPTFSSVFQNKSDVSRKKHSKAIFHVLPSCLSTDMSHKSPTRIGRANSRGLETVCDLVQHRPL